MLVSIREWADRDGRVEESVGMVEERTVVADENGLEKGVKPGCSGLECVTGLPTPPPTPETATSPLGGSPQEYSLQTFLQEVQEANGMVQHLNLPATPISNDALVSPIDTSLTEAAKIRLPDMTMTEVVNIPLPDMTFSEAVNIPLPDRSLPHSWDGPTKVEQPQKKVITDPGTSKSHMERAPAGAASDVPVRMSLLLFFKYMN